MPQHPVYRPHVYKLKGDDITDILKLMVGDVQGHPPMPRFLSTFLQPNADCRNPWQPGWHVQLLNTANADPKAKQIHGSHLVNGAWQYISGRNQKDLGTTVVRIFVDSYGPAAQSTLFSEIGQLFLDAPVTSLGQKPATDGWSCGYGAVWIFFLFLHFLVRKGCFEAYDVCTIPDLPHDWLHLCVALLRVRDTVNTMPKGHKHRIDLHAAFERAMTESPTTMHVNCMPPLTLSAQHATPKWPLVGGCTCSKLTHTLTYTHSQLHAKEPWPYMLFTAVQE